MGGVQSPGKVTEGRELTNLEFSDFPLPELQKHTAVLQVNKLFQFISTTREVR